MNQPVFVTVGDAVALTRPLESFSGTGALPIGTIGFVHGLSAGRFALVEFVHPDGETLCTVYVHTGVLRVVEESDGEPLRQVALDALYLVGLMYNDCRKACAAPRLPNPTYEQVSFEHMTPELEAALTANRYARVSVWPDNTTGGPEVWARLRTNGKG